MSSKPLLKFTQHPVKWYVELIRTDTKFPHYRTIEVKAHNPYEAQIEAYKAMELEQGTWGVVKQWRG